MTDEFYQCDNCGTFDPEGGNIDDIIQDNVNELKSIFSEAEERGEQVDITDIESNILYIHQLMQQLDDGNDFKCNTCGEFTTTSFVCGTSKE